MRLLLPTFAAHRPLDKVGWWALRLACVGVLASCWCRSW